MYMVDAKMKARIYIIICILWLHGGEVSNVLLYS